MCDFVWPIRSIESRTVVRTRGQSSRRVRTVGETGYAQILFHTLPPFFTLISPFSPPRTFYSTVLATVRSTVAAKTAKNSAVPFSRWRFAQGFGLLLDSQNPAAGPVRIYVYMLNIYRSAQRGLLYCVLYIRLCVILYRV